MSPNPTEKAASSDANPAEVLVSAMVAFKEKPDDRKRLETLHLVLPDSIEKLPSDGRELVIALDNLIQQLIDGTIDTPEDIDAILDESCTLFEDLSNLKDRSIDALLSRIDLAASGGIDYEEFEDVATSVPNASIAVKAGRMQAALAAQRRVITGTQSNQLEDVHQRLLALFDLLSRREHGNKLKNAADALDSSFEMLSLTHSRNARLDQFLAAEVRSMRSLHLSEIERKWPRNDPTGRFQLNVGAGEIASSLIEPLCDMITSTLADLERNGLTFKKKLVVYLQQGELVVEAKIRSAGADSSQNRSREAVLEEAVSVIEKVILKTEKTPQEFNLSESELDPFDRLNVKAEVISKPESANLTLRLTVLADMDVTPLLLWKREGDWFAIEEDYVQTVIPHAEAHIDNVRNVITQRSTEYQMLDSDDEPAYFTLIDIPSGFFAIGSKTSPIHTNVAFGTGSNLRSTHYGGIFTCDFGIVLLLDPLRLSTVSPTMRQAAPMQKRIYSLVADDVDTKLLAACARRCATDYREFESLSALVCEIQEIRPIVLVLHQDDASSETSYVLSEVASRVDLEEAPVFVVVSHPIESLRNDIIGGRKCRFVSDLAPVIEYLELQASMPNNPDS